MVNFSLFRNDPFNKLLSKLGLLNQKGKPRVVWVILLEILIAWAIPALLAMAQRVSVNFFSPADAYLFDFAAIGQFIIVVPILIAAEPYVDEEIEWDINHLFLSNLINKESCEKFKKIIASAEKAQAWKGIFILILVLSFGFGLSYGIGEFTNCSDNWHALVANLDKCQAPKWESPTWAGWWNTIFSQAILIFVHLRWFWKVIVWYTVLWKLSRMRLHLHATHPDQFGGLGFLANIQSRFSLLILAVGLDIAITDSYKIFIESKSGAVMTLTFTSISGIGAIAYVVFAPLLFLIPLLFFWGSLSETKRQSILRYSSLAMKYSNKIESLLQGTENKISKVEILNADPEKFPVLISIDVVDSREIKEAMEHLGALREYYATIQKMHTLPLDFQKTRQLFISAISPIIPLVIQYVLTNLFTPGKT